MLDTYLRAAELGLVPPAERPAKKAKKRPARGE
jgi:hypothetical protein